MFCVFIQVRIYEEFISKNDNGYFYDLFHIFLDVIYNVCFWQCCMFGSGSFKWTIH